MNYEELISDANLAFAGNQFEVSLKKAQEAINKDDSKAEGYVCAGKAALSLGSAEMAEHYFKTATEKDKNNGNIFFLLGYAQAMSGHSSKAVQSLTRALESNCDTSVKGQIYKMISMINTEQGDYDNALTNLSQAEDYIGLDYEILQQRAACLAEIKDYHQTIFVLNQMKLLAPKDYKAYSLAFNIFMELEIYDEAKAELERAEKFADLTMAYYNDRIAYTLLHDPANDNQDNIKSKWMATLKAIDDGLRKGEPTSDQVFELYLRAAQLYLSLENPSMAITILDAAVNPVYAFNNGFSVLSDEVSEESAASTSCVELSPEDEEAIMQEKWESGEFDDIREDIGNALLDSITEDSDELADEIHQYLTPVDVIPTAESEKEEYTLTGEFQMEQVQADMRNSMYIAAYELLGDYEKMLQKARELQASSIVVNQYSGIYYELKVGKYTQKDNWEKKYKERINFWTKRMLEDPTDFISASYRIRSYIDIGDFDNAEQLCACLPTDVKAPLMEEINKAKAQGGGEDGSTH